LPKCRAKYGAVSANSIQRSSDELQTSQVHAPVPNTFGVSVPVGAAKESRSSTESFKEHALGEIRGMRFDMEQARQQAKKKDEAMRDRIEAVEASVSAVGRDLGQATGCISDMGKALHDLPAIIDAGLGTLAAASSDEQPLLLQVPCGPQATQSHEPEQLNMEQVKADGQSMMNSRLVNQCNSAWYNFYEFRLIPNLEPLPYPDPPSKDYFEPRCGPLWAVTPAANVWWSKRSGQKVKRWAAIPWFPPPTEWSDKSLYFGD